MIKKIMLLFLLLWLLSYSSCSRKKQSWFRDYREKDGICSQVYTDMDLAEFNYQVGSCPQINQSVLECKYYINFKQRQMRCHMYYYAEGALEDVRKEAVEEACKALMAASVNE